ncbi:MFS transporter [Clostridium thailandense]|uniref:MFS transporter n=1 Tax=Clostridium thailandense TaxID=2794346 RepID=UPI00398A2B32
MDIMDNTGKSKLTVMIAILSFAFLSMGMSATSPALAHIAKAYPGVNYSIIVLIATMPALLKVPFSLITGKLAGTVIKFKTLMIIGTLLFLVGGVAPYFMSSFTSILAMRALVGIGSAVMVTLPAALIMNMFEGAQRQNLMGYNMVAQNIGGMIFQIVGGILCTISWRNTFLIYLLAIVSLIIIVFLMQEPAKIEKVAGEKGKIPGIIYVLAIFIGLYNLTGYPMITSMAPLIINNHYGTAAGAGFALTMFTVGGMVSGTFYGKIARLTTRYTISLGVAICSFASLLVIFATNLMTLTVAAGIAGVAGGLVIPSLMMNAGSVCSKGAVPLAMSILMATMALGGFSSGFVFAFIQKTFHATSLKFPFYISFTVFLTYAIISTLVILMSNKEKIENSQVVE